jgi:hypothetical protein
LEVILRQLFNREMLCIEPLSLEAFRILLHLFLKELGMVDGIHVFGLKVV